MFLKNYTSNVPVSQTIHRIEQVLLQCGVTGITKEYGPEQEIAAITFTVIFDKTTRYTIRLPANKQAAWDALWKDYAGTDISADGKSVCFGSRKHKTRIEFKEQAERTAWKIVQDWVEVQMSMIQLKQAEFGQVFLPYVWDGKETTWEKVQRIGFANLLPERTEQ